MKNIAPQQLRARMHEAGLQIIDVREPDEWAAGHLDTARHIPLDQLAGRLGELSHRQPVICYCAMGGRSMRAARLLDEAGFGEVYSLQGGLIAYTAMQAGANTSA